MILYQIVNVRKSLQIYGDLSICKGNPISVFLNTKGYMTGQLRQVTDYIHFTF